MALLVSLDDMKTYLGIGDTSYDTFLTQQITIVSDAIEGYCGRIFASTSYTQTFYGQDYTKDLAASYLYLYHYPVTAISQVQAIEKYSDATEDTTTITSDEYLLKSDTGKMYKTDVSGLRKSWFETYGFNSRIEITYTAGYASTPSPVEEVVYNLVEERYNKNVAGVGLSFGNDVQRVSIPGVMSIDFDYTLQSNERKSKFGMILGNYSNVLDFYATERSLIGEIRENHVS